MAITSQLLGAIRADVDAVLAAIGKKHGVLLNMGNARFTGHSATMKMEITEAGADTINPVADGTTSARNVRAEADFKAMATLYGLKPEWLHTNVTLSGKTFEIIGLLPNKHKNVVLIQGTGGGQYIVDADKIINAK